ncbi:MAG: hypothetical protein HYT87_11385 [Nitrospirae bacterium]|nr:hypothetical protein [Nitrospirota bacterium]
METPPRQSAASGGPRRQAVQAQASHSVDFDRLYDILDHMADWLMREDLRAHRRNQLEDEVLDGLDMLQSLRRPQPGRKRA